MLDVSNNIADYIKHIIQGNGAITLMAIEQGWANYGPLGNLTGPLALMECTFSYVYLICVLLENPINLSTKQLEYKMHETSVFVRTFRPFQSLGMIIWPPSEESLPTPAIEGRNIFVVV